MKRYTPFCLVLVLAAGLQACTSAGGHLNKARKLSDEGRYMDSAHRYLRALERDEDMTAARVGLDSLRARVLEEAAGRIDASLLGGDREAALGVWRELEGLSARSQPMGLPLSEADRDLCDRATAAGISALIGMAQSHEDAHRWDRAASLYQEALLAEGTVKGSRALEGRARSMIRQGEEFLAQGRPRDAETLANQVLALEPLEGGLKDLAARLRTDARALTIWEAAAIPTVYIAALPLWMADSVGSKFPAASKERMRTQLLHAFWTESPKLESEGELHRTPSGDNTVAIVGEDPVRVLRALRDAEYGEQMSLGIGAGEIGLALDVDILVTGQVVALEETTSVVDSVFVRRLSATARFVLIDVFGGEALRVGFVRSLVETREGTEGTGGAMELLETRRLKLAQQLPGVSREKAFDELAKSLIVQLRMRVFRDVALIITGP